jgi:hypothetical protein
MSLPEVATLVAAMVQARDAVSRWSWSHLQEPTGEAPHSPLSRTFRLRPRRGLAAVQGDFLFVALFGAAIIGTIIEAIRRCDEINRGGRSRSAPCLICALG